MDTKFPKGFNVPRRIVGARIRTSKPPRMRVSPPGSIIFNGSAARLLMKGGDEIVPTDISFAYDEANKLLAVKRVDNKGEFPIVLKMVPVGMYKRLGIVSFRNLAKEWHIPFPPKGYSIELRWSSSDNCLIGDLHGLLRFSESSRI